MCLPMASPHTGIQDTHGRCDMDHDTTATPATAAAAERRLHELSGPECWELIATDVVGRLAWTGTDGLTVVPVNYTTNGQTISVRTTAYSAIARECDDSPVAFEVDRHDPVSRTGWSVLIRGNAHIDFGDEPAPDESGVDVWPSGIRSLHLRIEPTQVSGRRLRGDR